SFLKYVYNLHDWGSENRFVFFIGVSVLSVLFLSTLLSIYTTYKLSLYGARIGVEFGDQLYRYYLQREWLFHTKNNSSQLTKKVSAETYRVTTSIINPFMQ